MVTKAVIKDTEAAIKDLEVETASPRRRSDLILQQEVGKARLLMVELQIVDKARQGGGSSRGRT